jgi:hypothetical protein
LLWLLILVTTIIIITIYIYLSLLIIVIIVHIIWYSILMLIIINILGIDISHISIKLFLYTTINTRWLLALFLYHPLLISPLC